MDMNMLMGLMKDLPKFSAQAQELIAKARILTEAIDVEDKIVEMYGNTDDIRWDIILNANIEFKKALANLPKLPNVIEG